MQKGQLDQHTKASESLFGSIRVMESKLSEAKSKKDTLKACTCCFLSILHRRERCERVDLHKPLSKHRIQCRRRASTVVCTRCRRVPSRLRRRRWSTSS